MPSWRDHPPETSRSAASAPKEVAPLLAWAVIAAFLALWVILMVGFASLLNVFPETETKHAVNAIAWALLDDNHYIVTGFVVAVAWFVVSLIRYARRR